jgi:hypothetical protein
VVVMMGWWQGDNCGSGDSVDKYNEFVIGGKYSSLFNEVKILFFQIIII